MLARENDGLAKVVIITHTDLDGVVSAVVYYLSLLKNGIENKNVIALEPEKDPDTIIHFTEPHSLHLVLKELEAQKQPPEKIVITDLGANKDTISDIIGSIKNLVKRGVIVEWYDHHKWDDSWVGLIKTLKNTKIFIETDTCAAGVVHRHVNVPEPLSSCISNLVSATCAADVWKWDNMLAPLLYRVTMSPRGAKGDVERRRLFERFSRCEIWSDDWRDKLEEQIDRELKGYSDALKKKKVLPLRENGETTAVFILKEKGHPPTSFLASFLLRRTGADIAVIVRVDGALSLRSRGVDVRELAVCLGGGGHPRASGAKIGLPFYYGFLRIILPFIYKRVLMKRVEETVKRCFDKTRRKHFE